MELLSKDIFYEILFLLDKHEILNFCLSCKRYYEIIFICLIYSIKFENEEFWLKWIDRNYKLEFETLEIFYKLEEYERLERMRNYFTWKNQKEIFGEIIETNLYKTSKSIWKINSSGNLIAFPLDIKDKILMFDNPYDDGDEDQRFYRIIGTCNDYCIISQKSTFNIFNETGEVNMFYENGIYNFNEKYNFIYISKNKLYIVQESLRISIHKGDQKQINHNDDYNWGNIILFKNAHEKYDYKIYYNTGYKMKQLKTDCDPFGIIPYKVINTIDGIYMFHKRESEKFDTFIIKKSEFKFQLLNPKDKGLKKIYLCSQYGLDLKPPIDQE